MNPMNPSNPSISFSSGLSPIISDFMSTLQEAERSRHATTLAALFSPDAELRVMTSLMPSNQPTHSAEEFWRRYLLAFTDISSEFTHVAETRLDEVSGVEADGRKGVARGGEAVTEWTSQGTLTNGQIVRYNGVSIFEHDGEAITTFRTYYDSAALLPEAPRTLHTHSHSVGMPHIGAEISS